MSDYRFQVVEHNGIPCLHVIFDEQVIDANGFERIIQTYIPVEDILDAIGQVEIAPGLIEFPEGETAWYASGTEDV